MKSTENNSGIKPLISINFGSSWVLTAYKNAGGRSLPRKCMAQAYAGLVFDKSNVVSVMCGFLVLPDARFCHAPKRRNRGPRHAPRVLGWSGAAESLAHHEVVGKRERESEPWRGRHAAQRRPFFMA